MDKIKNKIIVWSIDDFNTLGLMRELGQFNLDLFFLINGNKGFASKSIYCKHFLETKSIEGGYQYLLSSFSKNGLKPILITSSDSIIIFIDQHRDVLEEYFILPGCSSKGDTEKYSDKNQMTILANELGITCPKSRYFNYMSKIDDVEYPCLVKPSHEKPGHFNEFKYKICYKQSQLKRLQKFVNKDSEFILQNLIQKERDVLIYGGRMKNGKTVLAGAMIRDRFADSGSASHGIMTPNIPECVETNKIALFLEKIDYYGLFSFEYGMAKDKAYFFEVNLRNDGTSHYFFQAGANLPLAYVYSCIEKDYSSIPTTVKENRWFIDEFFDYENVLHRKISRKQWKHDLNEATVFKYYDKLDTNPWKEVKKNKTMQIFKDLVLKKFRLYIVFVLDKLGYKR